MKKFGIAVHGGAGTIRRKLLTTEQEKTYTKGLEDAIHAGYGILADGGTAVDAVETAIRSLEDFPYFNAGRGSVFNHEGNHEMDASIMNGKDLQAGAVCSVQNIKNPISLAKEVMIHSPHVFLCGEGAEKFARSHALLFQDKEYFFNQDRFDQLQKAIAKNETMLDHGSEKKFGTVGAVALSRDGDLAAGTSTGGITNKQFGRVGDSPIIGAGTYANNRTCAVSCTGDGEYFIRTVVAYDVSALMAYKNLSLKKACKQVVSKKLISIGGEGGLIAIDRACNIEMSFNSKGMYRGYKRKGGRIFTAIYGDE